ncbi:MAG: AraC family transcriptional regulator [Flavobacterium sp. JAD_PAG50586_2]|nr:MAG: AraC family transcriptional regulator [Flavobacterium sp. JAD_PAG50586_2]
MYQIFTETKLDDTLSTLSIKALLLETLSKMVSNQQTNTAKNPTWVAEIKAILNDQFSETLSLDYLSKTANIHPVHLSRDFPKYFNSGLGTYIRKLRIQKSLELIAQKNLDLTTIAFDCGFSDQSHFTRCFREFNGINPSAYRKILFS